MLSKEKRKNILAILGNIPYNKGGSGDSVDLFYLMKYLSDKYNVRILSLSSSTDIPTDFDFKLINQNVSGEIKYLQDELTVEEKTNEKSILNRYSILADIIRGNWSFIEKSDLVSDVIYEKVKEISSRNRFDFIYIDQNFLLPKLAYELREMAPVLLGIEDLHSLNMKRDIKARKGLLNKIIHYRIFKIIENYEKIWYPKVHKVATVSIDEAVHLHKVIPKANNIEVIERGTDTSYFFPNTSNEFPSTLVFTGTMSWKANSDAIIWFAQKVIPSLIEQKKEFKLYIVGRRPPNRILDLRSPNIIVTGEVSDVRPYVWSSSIYVAPMISGAGTKTKIFEAMAMGKAIVCTELAIEGMKYDVRDCVMIANKPAEYVKQSKNYFQIRIRLTNWV